MHNACGMPDSKPEPMCVMMPGVLCELLRVQGYRLGNLGGPLIMDSESERCLGSLISEIPAKRFRCFEAREAKTGEMSKNISG
jgi:hypothetical protein